MFALFGFAVVLFGCGEFVYDFNSVVISCFLCFFKFLFVLFVYMHVLFCLFACMLVVFDGCLFVVYLIAWVCSFRVALMVLYRYEILVGLLLLFAWVGVVFVLLFGLLFGLLFMFAVIVWVRCVGFCCVIIADCGCLVFVFCLDFYVVLLL